MVNGIRLDSPFFDQLEAAGQDEVLRSMQRRHFEPDTVICRAGEPGNSLFVIEQGLVHVLAEGGKLTSSTAPLVLSRLRAGDVIGELALLTGERRSATLVARVPTDVLELRREAFVVLIQRFPVLLANLVRIVSQRLIVLNAAVSQVHRSEAVGVLIGQACVASADDIIRATRAASAHPVATIDLLHAGDSTPSVGQVLERLDSSLRDNPIVLMLVGADHPDLPVLLDHLDRVVALLGPGELRHQARRLASLAGHLELFGLGTSGEPFAEPAMPRPVRSFGLELRSADLAWVGRHLARAKVGLALGAGGAKGYAHVAVLRALEQAGYTIDYVAGSSIGAWVGAWLACGMDANAIERTFRATFSPEVLDVLFRPTVGQQQRASELMARLARETMQDRDFADLAVPLVIMAVDMAGRQATPIAAGPVHEAVWAAAAMPGFYPPVRRDGQQLVDAVALTPVPTEAVREAGADIAIAVNLLGRDALPVWPGVDLRDPFHGRGVAASERYTAIDVLELAQVEVAARDTERADVPITPRFGPGTWRDFQLADLFLAAGAVAAQAALPALWQLARPQQAVTGRSV
jgi:NTE family protein